MEDLPSQLILIRKWFTDKSTIGEIFFLGEFECYTLEDTSRAIKVKGETAIPEGKYEVIMSYSNRFKAFLPLVLNVPQFEGIRIHTGNSDKDTQGCILLGSVRMENLIGESRTAMKAFISKLETLLKKEKVYLSIIGGVHGIV